MSDLISRKALLEDFRKSISESSDTLDWIDLINRQPTADMWILITDGFPKKERVIACNSQGLQMIGKLVTDFCGDNEEGLGVVCVCNKNSIINVIAWMPLPTPYKEGE